MANHKQLQIGALLSYSSILFNIIAGLLYTPWMIRHIGRDQFGLYTLAVSVIAMLSLDFGLGNAVLKFVTEYNAKKQYNRIRKLLGVVYKLYFFIDILFVIVAAVLYVFLQDIYKELTAGELEKFKVVFVALSIFSLISIPAIPQNGILISYEKFIFQKGIDLLKKILTIAGIVLALSFGYKLYALVAVNIIVGTLIIILKAIYINQLVPGKIIWKNGNKKLLKLIFSFSFFVTISVFAQGFVGNITPSIIARFSGAQEVALFGISMTIEGYVYSIALGLSGLFLAKIAHISYGLNKEKSKEELYSLMLQVGRIQIFVMGCLILFFILFGKEFIQLWVGDKFNKSYWIIISLISPLAITLTQQIGTGALFIQGYVKQVALVTIITAFVSCSTSFFLTPLYGATGSGIAIFIGNSVGQVFIQNILFVKKLNINVMKFFIQCHLRYLGSGLLLIACGFGLNHFIAEITWYTFIGKLVIAGLFYLVATWLFFFNRQEKSFIIKNLRLDKILFFLRT